MLYSCCFYCKILNPMKFELWICLKLIFCTAVNGAIILALILALTNIVQYNWMYNNKWKVQLYCTMYNQIPFLFKYTIVLYNLTIYCTIVHCMCTIILIYYTVQCTAIVYKMTYNARYKKVSMWYNKRCNFIWRNCTRRCNWKCPIG